MTIKYRFNAPRTTPLDSSARNTAKAWESFYSSMDSIHTGDSSMDYRVMAGLSAVYTSVAGNKLQMIKEIDSFKSNYLLDVVVSQLVDDALSPDIATGAVLQAKSANEAVQKELLYLDRIVDFNQLAKNVAPEVVFYGEYFIRTQLGTKAERLARREQLIKRRLNKSKDAVPTIKTGITDIIDDVRYGTVVPITRGGRINNYLTLTTTGDLARRHRADYVAFILDGSRVRMDINDVFNYATDDDEREDFIAKNVPRFIRVGKSIVYPILPKLKELDLLEKLIPATKLSKLSAGQVVGVNLNEKTEIKEAISVVRQLENLINKRVSFDEQLQDLTVENILNVAGKIKVIPLFGEKGTIQKLDYKQDEPDDLTTAADDIRRIICDGMGVPYELIFKSETVSKADTIRRYSRYLRRLRSIQRCISNGIKQLICIHLDNKGIEYNKKTDIDIEFLNKLVEVDNLDKLEHQDLTLSSLANLRDYVQNLLEATSPLKECINIHVYAEHVEKNLQTIGLSGLIDMEKVRQSIEKYNEEGQNFIQNGEETVLLDDQGKPTDQVQTDDAPIEEDPTSQEDSTFTISPTEDNTDGTM